MLGWPLCSPDLNIIENVGAMLLWRSNKIKNLKIFNCKNKTQNQFRCNKFYQLSSQSQIIIQSNPKVKSQQQTTQHCLTNNITFMIKRYLYIKSFCVHEYFYEKHYWHLSLWTSLVIITFIFLSSCVSLSVNFYYDVHYLVMKFSVSRFIIICITMYITFMIFLHLYYYMQHCYDKNK